jgi:hypothetical protein
MQGSTRVFPSVPVTLTGQSQVSHIGVKVLTGFMGALGLGALCEDRLGQIVPLGADLDILGVSPRVFGQLP